VSDLIPFFGRQRTELLTNHGIIDFWIELSAREAENDGKHSDEDRIIAITLLCDLWMTFTEYIDSSEAQVTTIVFMLKRAVRDRTRCLRIPAIA
jgi:hypothetical protein